MATETVHKVTLGSGKIVLIRDMKIKHQELAAKALGSRFADAPIAQQVGMQNELLKILIAEVDGKPFKSSDNLDDVLTMQEYNQCMKVVAKLGGASGSEDPLIEVVLSGAK
jgi:hypothetical protein